MSDRHQEIFINDQDWVRLQQWSDGYDAGWSSWMVDPTDLFDRGEYVAGFVRA